ncbi:DASH complex subunit Dam1-domain-containing protein [Peziza echinospora]|nr:DASH complex subunit Dam1-domain-containing protein [Peziza echinospora]
MIHQSSCPKPIRNESALDTHPQNEPEPHTISIMASETPAHGGSSSQQPRSRRNSRPTTPLRRSSRGSLSGRNLDESFPLDTLEPAFAELSDALTNLDDNFIEMQAMHDSLSRFTESFSSFLYGLNMNAFCVDFPEAPVAESFKKNQLQQEDQIRAQPAAQPYGQGGNRWHEGDITFMTNDTSFVNEPAQTQPAKAPRTTRGIPRGSGTRGGRAGRTSGIARGRGQATR